MTRTAQQLQTHLLSQAGSTRATAYQFGNKSLRIGNKTHVVWLDAVAVVKGRSYDHVSGSWSETYTIAEGSDNHTNPAITADKDAYLHLAWGPHGIWGGWNNGMFKWVRSQSPGDLSAWTDEHNFGYNSTYACLVHTPSGHDMLAYRGGESPASAMIQMQRPQGGWSSAAAIFKQDIEPQYTNMGAHIHCAQNGELYMGSHFYNVGGGDNHPVDGNRRRMSSSGASILKSNDNGQTWKTLSGAVITTPTIHAPAHAMPVSGSDPRLCGIVTDSKHQPWVLTCNSNLDDRALLLSTWDNNQWRSIDVSEQIPTDFNPVYAVLTIDVHDTKHIVCNAPMVSRINKDQNPWGHPSNEVFYLTLNRDETEKQCTMVSNVDENMANWLPTISLPGIYHPVEHPVILYTHGDVGVGCSPDTQTEVYCVVSN